MMKPFWKPATTDVLIREVVADNRVQPAHIEVLAGTAFGHAMLDPVVAFVAEDHFDRPNAQDEVVAGPSEGLRLVLAGDDEIVAEAAEDEVDAVAAMNGVGLRADERARHRSAAVAVAGDICADLIWGTADDVLNDGVTITDIRAGADGIVGTTDDIAEFSVSFMHPLASKGQPQAASSNVVAYLWIIRDYRSTA